MGIEAVPVRAEATPEAGQGTLHRVVHSPLALWIAFLVVHLVISGLALDQGKGLGDVFLVYKPWAQLGPLSTAAALVSAQRFPSRDQHIEVRTEAIHNEVRWPASGPGRDWVAADRAI